MARKKKSKGLRVSLMLTVGLMIVSFAAGMLTQKIVFREPQTDAGLTYIEDIPVMTDFLPEGTRAVRDRSARSSILSSTRPTTPAPAQMRPRTTRSSTRTPTPRRALFRGTTRWTITRSTTICRMMRLPITQRRHGEERRQHERHRH